MDTLEQLQTELEKVRQGIVTQEELRGILSAEQVEATLVTLREKEAQLVAQIEERQNTIKQAGNNIAEAKTKGTAVGGNVEGDLNQFEINQEVGTNSGRITGIHKGDNVAGDKHVTNDNRRITVISEQGIREVLEGDTSDLLTAVDPETALGHYLDYLISHNRYLQLKGIRSGGRLVNIELEEIYITLRATQQRTVQAEEAWLQQEEVLAPGERLRSYRETYTETVTISVNEALQQHKRLVVLGDPGSGKTTLLRYLTLTYATAKASNNAQVSQRLGVAEDGYLPILLPLRRIGAYLKEYHPHDDGLDGHGRLLDYLYRSLATERVNVPKGFFTEALQSGRAAIFLDGMDEVASEELRRRVANLIDRFTATYPNCRYVVTSRIKGYTGGARLAEGYKTSTVKEFSRQDVEQFLTLWHRLVTIGQLGDSESARAHAQSQTEQLMTAIRKNERIEELAINPLMLTVIALVHRDRVQLPDRRAELYDEAVNVLLGKWDEARGVKEESLLPDQPFETTDKKVMLQQVALYMQERNLKEIDTADLRQLLHPLFLDMMHQASNREAERVIDRFLKVIEERTGLLTARAEGVYAFSHLTFQEYLAALALVDRDDYIDYILKRTAESWWREVILLTAGHLSMSGKRRTTALIQAIAEQRDEPEPYHNLVLAAECLRDVGESRVRGNLLTEIYDELQTAFQAPKDEKDANNQVWSRLRFWMSGSQRESEQKVVGRRIAAAKALAQIKAGHQNYWSKPYGEPKWIRIPAGAFTMGEKDEAYQVELATFHIAQVMVTNAQYAIFVEDTNHPAPRHWEDGKIPRELEAHPVVYVSWNDALDYCEWLSEKTDKKISLPSEAQWEKAARGMSDQRIYPWGDEFDPLLCNSHELGLGMTTPVGIFPDGASPFGVLDMSGNVWEWTSTIYKDYPYRLGDGRENMERDKGALRVLRGGSFNFYSGSVRAASRGNDLSGGRYYNDGFRLCVVHPPS